MNSKTNIIIEECKSKLSLPLLKLIDTYINQKILIDDILYNTIIDTVIETIYDKWEYSDLESIQEYLLKIWDLIDDVIIKCDTKHMIAYIYEAIPFNMIDDYLNKYGNILINHVYLNDNAMYRQDHAKDRDYKIDRLKEYIKLNKF